MPGVSSHHLIYSDTYCSCFMIFLPSQITFTANLLFAAADPGPFPQPSPVLYEYTLHSPLSHTTISTRKVGIPTPPWRARGEKTTLEPRKMELTTAAAFSDAVTLKDGEGRLSSRTPRLFISAFPGFILYFLFISFLPLPSTVGYVMEPTSGTSFLQLIWTLSR